MAETLSKNRNNTVDVLRGIAMLLVIIGHIVSNCTLAFENTVVYKIIWSLQMPLFMLISGYVTRFSHPIFDKNQLVKVFKKRTLSYIYPWVIWTFIIRGLIFGNRSFLKIKWLLYHMDSGYWFLFSLWTISIVFIVSSFASNKLKTDKKLIKVVATGIVYVAFMALLLVVGLKLGLSFLCIKLTIYYMPFFFLGYMYGTFVDDINKQSTGRIITYIIIAICTLIWVAALIKVDIYSLGDNGISVILRFVISLCGCISVCGLIMNIKAVGKFKLLPWIGKHSLEIYVAHYLLLGRFKLSPLPQFYSAKGLEAVLLNAVFTIVVTLAVVYVLNINKKVRFIIFGRK